MDSAVMIFATLAVGLWTGATYMRFKRARADLRGTRKMIPGLRKNRTALGLHTLRAGLVMGFMLLVFVMGMRASGKM